MDRTTTVDNRSVSPDPHDKVESDHIELGHLQDKGFVGGHVVTQLPTTSSVQDADIEPDLQIRAVIITFAAGLFWFVHLYHLSALAAYSRNIAAILGNPDLSPWVFNAFNIPIIVVAPILSSLSDVTARKWFIVVPVAMGALGAVIACRASTLAQVIAGVAIEGFAGAAMGPITAVPSEVLPHKYRSIGASVVFAMSILGPFPSLPLLGMAIKQDGVNGWRWIFYSSLMGYALTAILWTVLYKPPPRRTEYTDQRPSVDWIGYVLLTGASVLFIAGLVWGGVTYPWKSGQVMGTLVTGIVLFIVLGLWEWKGRSDGFLHHDLFKERNFPLVIFAIGVEGLIYIAFSSLFPAQVSLVYEHDLVKSASLALPFYAAFFIALPFGALYVNKTRDLVTPVLVGYLLFIVGVVLFIVSKPNTMAMFIVGGAVAGFGFAFPLVFLTVIAQFAAPPALIGTSTSIVLAMRSLGGAVGSTITATILSTKSTEKIPAYVASATLPLGLSPQLLGPVIGAAAGDAELIQAILSGKIPGVTPQILGIASAAVEHAWSDSFKFSWIAVVAFGVLGLVSVSLLRRDRQKLDYIIDQPLEHVHHKHAHKNEV